MSDTPVTPINQVIPSDIADLTTRQTADAAADAAEEVVDYTQDTKLKNTSFSKAASLIAQDLSGDLSPDLVAWIKKRTDGGEDALLGENETLADTLNDIGIQFGSAAEGAVNCELDMDIKALNNKVLTATDTADEVAAVQQLVQLYDFDVIQGTSQTGIHGAINFILTDDVVADQVAEGNYSILASALLTYSPGLTYGLPAPNPTSLPPIPSLVNQIIALIKANVSTLKDYDNKHGLGDGGSRDQDYVLNIAGLATALAAAATPATLPLTITPPTPTPAPDGTYSITPSFSAGALTFSVPAAATVTAIDTNSSSPPVTVSNIGGSVSITGGTPGDQVNISIDDGILPATYSYIIPQSLPIFAPVPITQNVFQACSDPNDVDSNGLPNFSIDYISDTTIMITSSNPSLPLTMTVMDNSTSPATPINAFLTDNDGYGDYFYTLTSLPATGDPLVVTVNDGTSITNYSIAAPPFPPTGLNEGRPFNAGDYTMTGNIGPNVDLPNEPQQAGDFFVNFINAQQLAVALTGSNVSATVGGIPVAVTAVPVTGNAYDFSLASPPGGVTGPLVITIWDGNTLGSYTINT